MLTSDEKDYLAERAQRERSIARTCEDNAAALAHLRMAEEYERRLAELGKPEVPRSAGA